MLIQKRQLNAHKANHCVAGLPQRTPQHVWLAKAVREHEPALGDIRPQPLVDEGVAVGQRQGDDRLGRRFAVLQYMERFRQAFGPFAESDDQLWLARASGREQNEPVAAMLGGQVAKSRLDPVAGAAALFRDKRERVRFLPGSARFPREACRVVCRSALA